ncbi:uncharacterized protein LOC114360375 [Ostrinia furnacalis]|uniref:uncharacterized protein LOC114360375 n=1 Tax=Ostrinia furnacalis TaxID=93504 RepID=UPI00103BDFFA|nr:uncharacterized protein LOC114360375 [Ostrinia furnacalis]
MDPGFVKAESTNLPKIDTLMVANFFALNPDFCSAELRNVKITKSAGESYGDDAIGYVQLKRESKICTVKCKMCPEHKVRSKQYTVSAVIDEEKEEIISVLCQDCPAAAGGCKHAVAFLMWLHRRSEEPSCTSVECYWKKSNLSKVGSTIKVLTAKEMCKRKHQVPEPDTSVMEEFLIECKNRKIKSCQFIKHVGDYEDEKLILSLHYLVNTYKEQTCDSFLSKTKHLFNEENIKSAEIQTRNQNKSSLWFELRYGRVTASKSFEVSRCRTHDGSLVAKIFGARSVLTAAMKRGQKLEEKVREVVEKKLGLRFAKCGLFISDEYPMIAGSPDGISTKGIIEIKCPSNEKNREYYIKNGQLSEKCLAQVQIQMYCVKAKLTYFCVAGSDFENTKEVTILPICYNELYVKKLIDQIVPFWSQHIFPKLFESVTQ